MRSWVSEFVRAPYRRRIAEPDWVWSRSVNVSLRAASDEGDIAAAAAAAQVEATKRAATKAATRVEIKEDGSMAGDLWRRYDLDGTVGEARKLALAGSDVNNWSVRQMDRMRAGVFNTTQRLARCEFVSGMWRAQCPYCLQPVPEDLAHFLLECPEWRSARMRFIMPVLRRAGCGGWIGNVELVRTWCTSYSAASSDGAARCRCRGRVRRTRWPSSGRSVAEKETVAGESPSSSLLVLMLVPLPKACRGTPRLCVAR